MFTFDGHCPHCGSDRGFVAFGISEYVIDSSYYEHDPKKPAANIELTLNVSQGTLKTQFSLAGNCIYCKTPVVAVCQSIENIQKEIEECIKSNKMTCNSVNILRLFPEKIPHYTHPSLPEDVRAAFVDLQKMLQLELQPHFIITGCRTVLEAAVKALGGEGNTLKKRIDDLHTQGKVTSVLHEWASHVRLCGNDAAHEMTGNREEAQELVEFTKVFLQFTFELPARIATVRAKNP